jgi:signal transduction histidine kinase
LSVPPARLPERLETAVYFMCSEALANVQKHAQATGVDVELRIEDGSVAVVVADDGVGGAEPSTGSGLNGLRDRIEALGGRLSIDSPRGEGTRVTAEIPIVT